MLRVLIERIMNTSKPVPIRRKAREWALCLLYEREIRGDCLTECRLDDLRRQITSLEVELGLGEVTKIIKMTVQTYKGVLSNLDTIDRELIKNSHNWRLDRMALVDRNVMRIAIYEILFQEDIPNAVSINEAIEIAKRYAGEDSGRFVNGILDKVGRKPDACQQIEV